MKRDMSLSLSECPACGLSPEHDIHGRPYDCVGYPAEPHVSARPVARPVTGCTMFGHDEPAPLVLRHRWMREARRG